MHLPNLAPVPELYVSYESAQKLKVEAGELSSWDLTRRQICDLELLMNGGFNPLKGFMSEADYTSVVDTLRLSDGTLFPMPITLDVSQAFADSVEIGLGVAFGVVLWIGNELSTWLADAAGAAYDESLRELLAPASAGGWLILFGAVLPTIAVAEEVLFRAALIGVPAAGFGVSPWLLAAVSSVAFALGHGAQGRVGIVVTGLLGFVLAAGYIRSGSLLVVIVAHYLVNATEFFAHEYLGVGSALAGRG